MHATKGRNRFFSFISSRIKKQKPGNLETKLQRKGQPESWRPDAVEDFLEPDFPIVTAEKFQALCSCLKDNGVEETETVAQAICYILCDEETEQYFQPSNETVQYYFPESGYLEKELRFDTPILEVCFPDEPPYACRNFREYATIMMFPDPTYVEITSESQDLITSLINDGKMGAFEALRTFESGNQYDENGREYISFPTPEKILEIYQKSILQVPRNISQLEPASDLT